MLRRISLFFLLLFMSLASLADNVLVVHQNYNNSGQNIGARLAAAGHTVTYMTSDPTAAQMANYKQIWDVRYSTAISGTLATNYDNFVKNSGFLYLTTENPGCCANRNNSVASFISAAGGGSTTIGGNVSNSLTVVNTTYITAGKTITMAAGSLITNSKGTWLFKDTSGNVAVMMWVGNAGALGTGYTGTIMVVTDINWTDATYFSANNSASLDNLISGIVYGTVQGTISSSGNTAPAYSSSITSAQQTRKNNDITLRNSISGNQIYIDQAGDNNTYDITQTGKNDQIRGINQQNALLKGNTNTVTVKQGNSSDATGKDLIKLEMNTGSNSNQVKLYQGYNSNGTMNASDSDNHIISLSLTGSGNQVNLYQTNDGGNNAGHYAEMNITGSTNNITVNQKNNTGKTMFGSVSGNGNTISATQEGTGADFLDIKLTGNGHNVTANQSGTGNHAATIDLTNGGGASTVNLTQSGSTAQVYSIQQTCVNVNGCSVTVTQP